MKLVQNIECEGCLRLGNSRGEKAMPEKLEMFVLVICPIASTPFHQVNKDSCRVHHSYSIAMFSFASTQRTDISIMPEV